MKLEFSPQARYDLLNILHNIAADKPKAATQFVQDIEKQSQLLTQFPSIRTLRNDLMPDLRVFTSNGYGIYFRVIVDLVRIERVLGSGLNVSVSHFD